MTLVKNRVTGNWEADFRAASVGRLHVSLRTKRKAEATDRHAALQALVREHPSEVIEDLRAGRVTVEAITRVHLEREPFTSLARSHRWPTLADATATHLAFLREQTDNAGSTVLARERHLAHTIERFGADRRVDTITHDEIGRWKGDLLAQGAKGKPIKPWSVAQYLIHTGALYNWLVRQEERRAARERRPTRILHNPVEREMVPGRSDGRVRFLSKDEAQRLLAATPESLRAAVALGLFAGLRIGEVITLRPPPHDLDLSIGLAGVVTVQEKEGWRPKSRKRREVPIGPELRRIVDHHLAHFASELWVFPARRANSGSADGRSSVRGYMQRDTLDAHMRRIVLAAKLIPGVKHPLGVTFHTLRHTFASWLVMAGVDLFTVAKLMGHADTKQVENTYGHLSPGHKRLAIETLGDGLTLGDEDAPPAATQIEDLP